MVFELPVWKSENVLNICEQLGNCSNIDEVKKLKKSLNRSNIGNRGKSIMLSDADIRGEADRSIKGVENFNREVHEGMRMNLVGENFARYMDEFSYLLANNKASSIGVWGMGGVGKTTLVRHLHDRMLTQPDIYGSVYWITISKDCSIQKLQTDIANRIGESISNRVDESQRAGILAKALKRKKNFVMVLDDMWSYYDSNEVGLGSPKEIGYRLIVTSRSKNVCLTMHCDHIIEVEPLSPKDAWTLFINSIGSEIPDSLTKISTDVLQECAGLPLGIITLAKSMIGSTDVYEWSNVLNELRNPSGRVNDMEDKVFKVLRLSYERLEDDQMKKCLLYCATYPEDYEIEMNELVWLFIDAGLLGKNERMAKMFDRGLVILKKLELAALLSIEGHIPFVTDEKVVVLHDLIRDMALQIAGSRFMIKVSSGFENIPDEESWTNELEVVSLVGNDIKELSEFSPRCTRLSVLSLQINKSLYSVDHPFFRYLHRLKHLDLSCTRIRTLPKSISQLRNLTSLILRGCLDFTYLPSLGILTSLERLDLFGTSIMELPEDMRLLIKLRYLNIYDTSIERIDAGVIRNLTALQYLAIEATFDVEELKSLNNLEHLTILFKDFDRFSKFSTQMKIKGRPNSYIFVFGDEIRQYYGKRIYLSKLMWPPVIDKEMKSLVYFTRYNQLTKILDGRVRFWHPNLWGRMEIERKPTLFCADDIQVVLQDIKELCIKDDGDLMSLGDFVLDSVLNLQRQSKLKRGSCVRDLKSSGDFVSNSALYLRRWYKIKRGRKPFFNLTTLIISGCSKMKKLIPLALLTNLQNIQEIRISWCKNLEALIEEADDKRKVGGIGHPQKFSLPTLVQLHLNDLPNLHNLCGKDKVIYTPSLQWISITSCRKLKRMSFDLDNQHQQFRKMDYAKDEEEWLQSLQWDPPESKTKMTFVRL